MSAGEIKSFEDFWNLFSNFFYEVIDFLKKAFPEIADKIGGIHPVYPKK